MWYLERFGDSPDDTELAAIFNRRENMGTAPVESRLIATPSGYFDPLGAGKGKQTPPLIEFEGELFTSDMSGEIEALTALIGKRDNLYRTMDDGTEQWCLARCLDVNIERQWPKTNTYPVRMQFQSFGPWNGVENGTGFSTLTSPTYIVIVNTLGNIRQPNVALTIRPTTYAMTNVEITSTIGVDLEFTGTVSAGDDLVIDGDTMAITNDGSDAYDDLTIGSGHTLDRFLAIDPSSTGFSIIVTGPTQIQYKFNFYDAWA